MFKKIALVAAFAVCAACPTFATSVTPGSTVAPSPFTSAGVALVSPIISGTISPGTFTASYQTGVYTDSNNSYCSGCLDFIYSVTNSGPGVVERVTMFDFDSFFTNVGYVVGSGDVAPVEVDRTVTGGTIGFSFDTAGLISGQTGDILIIQTNARNYTNGLFSIQDGSAGTGSAYQPTSATPEPASLSLIGAGLVALGFFGRRRRSA